MSKRERVRCLLESGVFTSIQLCKMANTPDARKIISRLRADFKDGKGGADVQGEWRKDVNGTRHKVYWISQHLTTKGGMQ